MFRVKRATWEVARKACGKTNAQIGREVLNVSNKDLMCLITSGVRLIDVPTALGFAKALGANLWELVEHPFRDRVRRALVDAIDSANTQRVKNGFASIEIPGAVDNALTAFDSIMGFAVTRIAEGADPEETIGAVDRAFSTALESVAQDLSLLRVPA